MRKIICINLKLNDMYTSSIIWLLTWPLLIFICYKTIRFTLNKLNKQIEKE